MEIVLVGNNKLFGDLLANRIKLLSSRQRVVHCVALLQVVLTITTCYRLVKHQVVTNL